MDSKPGWGSGKKNSPCPGIYINLADQFLPDAHVLAECAEAKAGAEAEADNVGGEPEDMPANQPLPSMVWREQCKDFIPRLLQRCGLEGPPATARLYFGGHAGFVTALQEAVNTIRQGTVDRCLVGGIDCCVEPAFLWAAVTNGLLKTAINPCGFHPGEAAAFLLLERLVDARSRKANALAILGETAIEQEAFNRLSDKLPQGAALATVLRQVLSRCAPNGSDVGLVIGDLNGDTARAMDWGYALVRLAAEVRLGELPLWLPAQSFGETGAATGPSGGMLGSARLAARLCPDRDHPDLASVGQRLPRGCPPGSRAGLRTARKINMAKKKTHYPEPTEWLIKARTEAS